MQYAFPDAAEFGGSLLDVNSVITESMEMYSKQVLLLFLPFRQLTDISLHGLYTLRLREAIANGIIGEKALQFLQNV